jgi:hypothetical protein
MSDGPPPGFDEAPPGPSQALIFKPAKRERIGLIIGLSGPSWSGKTLSALRLARGIAGPKGRIGLIDTERGRALTYADDFDFDHAGLNEPFSPGRYAAAAAVSKQVGHDVLIIDSASHEHAGPGGLLEMHEAELTRLTGGSNDFARREAMKMVAWIKPKSAHKAMVQRLLQLNSHLILNFRAEAKTEIQMLPNKAGKLVATPVPIGFQAITGKEVLYELTILLGFDPKNPGVPIGIKLADKFKPFVPLDRPLDESTGARLAAWARGEQPLPYDGVPPQPSAPPAPAPALDRRTARERRADGEIADPPPQAPLTGAKPSAEAISRQLTEAFERVEARGDHLVIVDAKTSRDQIAWLKKHRRDLWEPLDAAIRASWARTAPVKETA